MWTCPKCKQKFVNTHQSHSCGVYSIDKFLEGKTHQAIGLFHAFLNHYKTIGEFELHPVKTRVALLTLMRFAAINKVGRDYLDGHLVLVDQQNDACFRRIENLNDRFFVHHFRLRNPAELKSLRPYMIMAYEVGRRKHVLNQGLK
jgi:hypothetical protein